MRHEDDDKTVNRSRKLASGVVASAAVVAANLLVVIAEAEAGQGYYDLDVDFVVPVLERREAVLPEPPEQDGAPWIESGIAPRL